MADAANTPLVIEKNLVNSFVSLLEEYAGKPIHCEAHDSGVYTIYESSWPFMLWVYPKDVQKRLDSGNSSAIHIDTYQLINDQLKIVKRLLIYAGLAQKIFARKTTLSKVNKIEALAFLKRYHIQEPFLGKHRWGLYYNDELVSLAVFSNKRTMREKGDNYQSAELIRFCNKSPYVIVGGLSKLLKHHMKSKNLQDIMTYVDKDWGSSKKLEKIGFELVDQLAPISFWIHESERFLVRDPATLLELKERYPSGYLKENSGSLKMLLKL